MGRASMAKAVAFAVLAVVLVMRGAGAVQENVEDVVELPENPAAGTMGKCVRSIRALHSVCGLYGESSEACKETKAAHEHQCQSLLGESGNGDGLGCRNNNFDTEKRVICNAAKVVCNIPGKDYCMTSLLVNCMKSIGQMCPSSDKKRPKTPPKWWWTHPRPSQRSSMWCRNRPRWSQRKRTILPLKTQPRQRWTRTRLSQKTRSRLRRLRTQQSLQQSLQQRWTHQRWTHHRPQA